MSGILSRLLQPEEGRASLGQGFHVKQSPPAWVVDIVGSETFTGVVVNEETAMNYAAVYACVRILAETVAMLPLILYQREGQGKRRATEHALYALLHDMPNGEMSAYTFKETLMGHLALWGNAYAEIEFDRRGQVVGLWPLRPDKMEVRRAERGDLVYTYTLPKPDSQGRRKVDLTQEQVFHVKGLGFDGLRGYDPIHMARQSIGLGLATEEHGARFYGNGARPGGVLEHPGKLGDTAYDRLKGSWEKRHQGIENTSRIAILEEGTKYHAISIPPEEAQFLQTRKFQISEIARWYRVPLHMLAELERATHSNIEHQGLEFATYSMGPWFTRWEQEIHRSLLLQRERQAGYQAEFLIDALLRGDIKTRYEAYHVARMDGWMSANDIRARENMNPIEGGDVYWAPINMIPADQMDAYGQSLGMESEAPTEGEAPAEDGAPPDDGERDARALEAAERERRSLRSAQLRHRLMSAHFRLYEDVAARVLRREINDVGNKARTLLQRRDLPSFNLWLEEFYREHVEFVERQFQPLYESYGEQVVAAAREEVGEPAEMTDRLRSWIASYLAAFAARHAQVSRARLQQAMARALENNEEPLDALEGEISTWEEKRSAETARWESVRFNNGLAKAAYVFAGVQRLRWRAFGENCAYCSSLNGQVVGINSFFIQAGTEFQPDGADRPLRTSTNVGHAPAHDGCDCMVTSA